MDFEEQSSDKATIWRHFLRALDKKNAKCKICNKVLKSVGGSTGSLHKHLKNIHQIDLSADKTASSSSTSVTRAERGDIQSDSELPSSSKKTKLTDYFESNENPSIETRISRMVALDGIPFRTLEKSEDIREVFGKAGLKIPKSANTIREMVFKHCDEKKTDLKKELQNLLSEKVKFVISFDEWSSNRNRRYLSLNLHSPSLSGPNKFKTLGLLRVHGSLPANKCIEEIERKLETFGVSLKRDIIGETTDGCNLMIKIGKELNKQSFKLHQKCLAHAIQLALSDVFYKTPTAMDDVHEVVEQQDLDEDDMPLAELAPLWRQDNLTRETVDSEENDDDNDGVQFLEETRRHLPDFKYFDLLKKVRKVVKIFKKSPTKNDDILQKYVTSEFGKEYTLILDAKTRWSSMADMLKRFLMLQVCIIKALLDINSDIVFSQDEWGTLHELHEILDIMKTVVESLCRRDASLVTADVAIKFAQKKLKRMNTFLSQEMENALKKRYSERRLIEAATLQYLTNPDQYFDDFENDDLAMFPRPTSDEMCRGIVNLIQPVSGNDDINEEIPQQGEDEVILDLAPAPLLTKKEELDLEILKATTAQCKNRQQDDEDFFTTVKIEMTLFENGGSRGSNLSLAYDYLKAIPPTSVEPEHVPYLELAEPDEGYHGLIRENETLVEVTPAIRARGPLCSFLILNNKHHGEAPFEIMVIDENEARLRVRFPLNCEKRRNYKFDIAAVGCDGSYSNTVPVHITVTDVNEFAPVFPQSAYVKSVDEGRIYDEIVRVEATDRDCTPRYGDVCKYEILTDRSQPFAIDNYGVIRNTEPLDYEKSHNHILSVVAYDCGMMQSAPVMVTIKVNKPCRAGWKGVAERVDYAPGTGPLALFPAARLEACSSDERCPGVTRIQAAVTLQASRAGSGCDRDTYAVHSQKTICGLDPKTVDLLPSPGAGNEWAKALKPDSGRDGEQMFEFDGSTTSAAVPNSVLSSSLAGSFSISTWMRHAPPPDHDKHRKEHVLCLADDHKMNRHHYALFVRNCRLILLLRRDFGDGDLNIFRPAEWRWKIPEVCDNEWHHYAVNVRFPNVELFIDGEPYRPIDGKGPEVIDDWPLHPAHGVNTTLVVGACWQGTEGDMKHHLHGWLAGLGVLVHSVQSPSALKCVAHCREGLSLAPDLYLKSVSVEGDGVADVETLLRRVAYGDARAFPTPGRRNVHVATTITCDNGRIIKAKPAESYIMVLQPQTPSILINGTDDAARDYAHFRQGLRVFPELSVRVLAAQRGGVREADTQKLDSCVVSVYPALNPDHEALSLRSASDLPLRYDIRAAVTRDGVILTGSDTVQNYQQVLREIEYSNKKPAYYLNRVFKLTCSELDGRFTSNEYVQTLTVVHPHMSGEGLARELHPSGVADKMDAVARDKQPAHAHGHALSPRVYAAHSQRDAHSAEMPAARLLDTPQASPTNHVALLIGVVSCGVVVLAAGVAAARARAPRPPRPRPAKDEMAWDDSALTITLNPMDEQAAVELGKVEAAELSSDGESCDDSDSDRHDSSDDDEEVMSGKQHKYRNISQLEWDNSTM